VGAGTSVVSGYIGMQVAVRANVRTTKLAMESLDGAFKLAFKGGLVLGFTLVGCALLNLMLLIMWYRSTFLTDISEGNAEHKLKIRSQQTLRMFEAIAGYGLGGSTVALFGRVGGGIFTKAADVGADLVGKVIENMDEDSIQNPAVIADNVGDNVGDIAGMGSDLFGSFAEATCACLVISATSPQLVAANAMLFPLMITALGIFVGLIVSFFSSHIHTVDEDHKVELSLKLQLILTTILMTPGLYVLTETCLPKSIEFPAV
jgi:inorganic pyrophosphatase